MRLLTVLFLMMTAFHPAMGSTSSCQLLDASLNAEAYVQSSSVKTELLRILETGQPSEFLEVKTPEGELRYLSVSRILERALGMESPAMLTWSSHELRFLPYVQQDSELILIPVDQQVQSEERMALMIATARRLGVSLSVVITSQNRGLMTQLSLLSSATGGKVLDLSPCR